MSLDRSTRNALAAMVGKARERLKLDVMDQLRRLGFQDDGTVLDLDTIGALSEGDRAAGQELRALLEHFAASEAESGESSAARRKTAYDRLAREIGFTTLNRLVALRMAEERELIVQAVGDGLGSRGFQVYERVAGTALGSRVETYRAYLECLYDEIARDLPVLFDRTDPQSRIFPGERTLEDVLRWLNDPVLANLWNEDETIGWVYQYYNDPDERKKMRESQAPRTSRELAVRNQFFTPRYVVEFLTDNTLGRLWYEMRQGDTRLVEQCAYLVRRKHTVFLAKGQTPPTPFDPSSGGWGDPDELGEMWTRPNPDLHDLHDIMRYALTVGGYAYAQQYMGRECDEVVRAVEERRREKGKWEGSFEELRCTLFARQRAWHHWGYTLEGDWTADVQALYRSVCSQWDLETEYVPYRAPQPPRRIKLLDPACGSCHFLLYAFDLLATMYEEAEPELPRHEIPARILQYNLHGIDIDPRAVQIAGLALYLKARKYEPAARVAGMNIVCAAPMPGERRMFEEFLARLNSPTLARIADGMWDELKLAGVAGSLLKPEQRLREVVAEQRTLYQASSRERQLALLPDYEQPEQLPLDFSDVTDDSFWDIAEERILAVLRDYSEQADGDATTRHLFAEDSMQGFRFVDLMRKRYDVVLMNPPFGDAVGTTINVISDNSPYWSGNLASAFIERTKTLLSSNGQVATVTDRTILIKSSYEAFRRQNLLLHSEVGPLADLGWEVLDANVEVTVLIVSTRTTYSSRVEAFLDCREQLSKDEYLLSLIGLIDHSREQRNGNIHWRSTQVFSRMPNAAIAYDIPDFVTEWFDTLSPLSSVGAKALQGHAIKMDWYGRLRWEVLPSTIGPKLMWSPMYNGGAFSRFYQPSVEIVRWMGNGIHLKSHPSTRWSNADSQQKPGIGYGKRGDILDAHVVPVDHIFTVEGLFVLPKDMSEAWFFLGILNSPLASLILNYYTGQHKHAGYVDLLPVPASSSGSVYSREISRLARQGWELKRNMDQSNEVSPFFSYPCFRTADYRSGNDLFKKVQERLGLFQVELESVVRQLEANTEQLYRLSLDDKPIVDAFASKTYSEPASSLKGNELANGAVGVAHDYMSYLVGCIFGRWDIRMAEHSELAPQLPGPFESIPVCPPSMLVGPDILPAQTGGIVSEEWLRERHEAHSLPVNKRLSQPTIADRDYPLGVQWSGILVDDPEHPSDDLVRRVRDVLADLWDERAPTIEEEIRDILKLKNLRDYFRKPGLFFANHLSQYSKSRRQAPIYWPLSTTSGSYTLWLYYPRLTSDTLYTAVNRYVEPKLAQVGRELGELEGERDRASGREAVRLREQVEGVQAFRDELVAFRDELLRVAALPYRPDLNDGVIINAAPLHRLFRLPKWAKDTKECWAKLERGEYDWAHLAYTVWPVRVREKCRGDKSLAIAHGLEELYVELPATTRKRT